MILKRPATALLFAGLLMTAGAGLAFAEAPARVSAQPAFPMVAGWIERMSVPGSGLAFDAKLDTGADTSSIGANRIRMETAPDGARRVRFELTDDQGQRAELVRPIVRTTRIKRAGSRSDERAVVELDICLAGLRLTAQFTLATRDGLSTQVLIGRNVLAGRFLVDPARRALAPTTCPAS